MDSSLKDRRRGIRTHAKIEAPERQRSRSPEQRRLFPNEQGMSRAHGGVGSPRRGPRYGAHDGLRGYSKWKTEGGALGAPEEAFGGVPGSRGGANGIPGSGLVPGHAVPGMAGRGLIEYAEDIITSVTGAEAPRSVDDGDTDEMMTFRTFVIDQVNESDSAPVAVMQYEKYKTVFATRYTSRVYWNLRDLPFVAERYNPQFLSRQVEELRQTCRLEASNFVKLLAEERFVGISLVDRFSKPRKALDCAFPFCVAVGSSLGHTMPPSLSAPFWFPPDPDMACLCWKNVPATISKWDLKEHVAKVGALDGLIDITFVLDRGSGVRQLDSPRTAWIKYSTDENAAAADVKLDGTQCGGAVCRPVRRIPTPSDYVVRVTPSEACHPARILRDLHISARLILKLDQAFGVSELLGVPSVTDQTIETFKEACSAHPVLADALQIGTEGGRSAEEQLDLQLIYLRVAHNLCYYSGRRFLSQRELWDAVGALYLRPRLGDNDFEGALRSVFSGFGTPSEGWDSAYIEAKDVWGVTTVDATRTSSAIDETTTQQRPLPGTTETKQEYAGGSGVTHSSMTDAEEKLSNGQPLAAPSGHPPSAPAHVTEDIDASTFFLDTQLVGQGATFEPVDVFVPVDNGSLMSIQKSEDGLLATAPPISASESDAPMLFSGATGHASEATMDVEGPKPGASLIKVEAGDAIADIEGPGVGGASGFDTYRHRHFEGGKREEELGTSETPVTGVLERKGQLCSSKILEVPRGRRSPWLQTLDVRLRRLFSEECIVSAVHEESPDVQASWDAFFQVVVEMHYDKEHNMEKWVCHLCGKKFRGLEYIKKHLRLKHTKCLEEIVNKIISVRTRKNFEADPYRLPVPLPAPTPYLYRKKSYISWRSRQGMGSGGGTHPTGQQHPLQQASAGGQPSLQADTASAGTLPYSPFMPNAGGPRLGIGARGAARPHNAYRDWDAPAPETFVSQGNLRASVLYDDL